VSGHWPFTAEKIATRLTLIAPHVHRRTLPLAPFRMLKLASAMVDAPLCSDPSDWEEIAHQSYWGAADVNFVMKSRFQVPPDWCKDQIALHLPLGVLGDIFNHPEALVHVDQQPIGSADRYHHTVPLAATLADGGSHALALHGWTGLAGWPPDPASKARLFMGTPALVERDPVLLAFHRLASAALDTARLLDAKGKIAPALLAALDKAFLVLDTRHPLGEALHASAPTALVILEEGLAQAGSPLDVRLHGIGHAHMDIGYLWPVSQIRLKNARTSSNVLRLMEAQPDYHFSHSQPQLYAMTAQDYPQIFKQIKARVAEGRWEVMGGMWVEPDLNIPGPEALIRQLTLGRGYFRDTFGDVETPVLWLPDTFGFPAQIPQLMQLAGLKWFVTNKLNWNQLNPVPSTTHHWEGIDGSRVLAQILTTPRDVQYLPFPTNYKSDLSAREVLGTWTRSTAPDGVRDLPICYGYGDGGGGPTEDLLTKARANAAMPGMPCFQQSTVRAVMERIEASGADLPVWKGEHYLEGHRGVYTSQGWIKRANRKAEWALHEAEALMAMAGIADDLTQAWQLLCLNQFHDILSGVCVPEVFQDSRRDYAQIMQIAEAASSTAAQALALPVPALASTSPLSGPRLVLIDGEANGRPVVGQAVEGGMLAYFDHVPAYGVIPLADAKLTGGFATAHMEGQAFILENPAVRVTLNALGQIESVLDRASGQELLRPGALGNRLVAFEDRPICWDAWDIDPAYDDRPEDVQGDTSARILESGPLRACVEFTMTWRRSTLCQRVELCAHSNRLDFVTFVDWHESHTLLKAGFATGILSPSAEYDVQWGRVSRSTSRDTPFDAARFEVPAQKWARLADEKRAVAVLNDCKYGYDVLGDTIRVTLIKSATSPDPMADQGAHQFTYSLFASLGGTASDLDFEAYDLNVPVRTIPADPGSWRVPRALVQCSAAGVIVETLKPATDGSGVILRLFEAHGVGSSATLRFETAVQQADIVSIFEDLIMPITPIGRDVAVALTPFQIVTLRVILQG
jgi:alpha-mannosidase